MIRSLIFLCLLFSSFRLFATDGEWAVARINPALIKNAHAVVRLEDQQFEVQKLSKAVLKCRYVLTVLDEKGDDEAAFIEYYDKFQKIVSIEGVLYDASGKSIKKIKTKDTEDLSGVSGISLMDDNRIRRHHFYYRTYPYTVEYTWEIEFSSTLFFPFWIPQHDEHISVEKSSMKIITPANYELRYKEFNYPGTVLKENIGGSNIYTWKISDLPAIIREPYSPQWHEITTMAIFAASDFEVQGYVGSMRTWQDFGKFVHALKEGKDELPDEIKKEVHRISDQLPDVQSKIKALYSYLQKNTRYISIQLGIGGWQPFDAKFVANKSYGDCKALTNYMYSLLKEAGVQSYYTLVRAGKGNQYLTTDFPSQQFNHVILAVPTGKDTTWLECTDQNQSPGYMGQFTGNRPALLVSAEGGKLVSTPSYNLKENIQARVVHAQLDNEGRLTTQVNSNYKGVLQDELQMMINSLSKEKVKEHLHEDLDFATYEIRDFNYQENKSALPSINENLHITVENYATITGKRLFIVPNIMSRFNKRLSADETRKYDIVLTVEYAETDSVEIDIPEGYTPESIPPNQSLVTVFGKYESKISISGNKIRYYRNLERFSGRFPAKKYNDMVGFFDQVYKADRNKIVLVRKEPVLKGF